MNDSIGDRMKLFYESRSNYQLTRRVPVIIRVDGKCFSKFCKRFVKPYDTFLNTTLNQVMLKLCQNVQGVKFTERHSDEISLLVTDYDDIKTDAYFDYKIQKICSTVAALATAEFCRILIETSVYNSTTNSLNDRSPKDQQQKIYLTFSESWPTFDARCFNIPKEEVVNYFWWRTLDCLRTSVNMLAQSKFSHKELTGKNSSQMQEMLFISHGINWNDLPQEQKTGFMCFKENTEPHGSTLGDVSNYSSRTNWTIKPCYATVEEARGIITPLI